MTESLTVGIVSPGAMGSALGRCFAAAGHQAVATTAGRSARTAGLATGLQLLSNLAEVLSRSDLVLSVVPPAQATQVATEIAAAAGRTGVKPLVADLNAIAPGTLDRVAGALAGTGCELLDGSISGGPPTPGREPTIVYLSGPAAGRISALDVPGIDFQPVGSTLGTASAVKMCTASVYKGLSALLAQALQTAAHHGVTDVVLADLARDLPEHVGQAARVIAMAASKSDRYPGEMRQIALTQAAAGAPGVLFEAMALVYESMHGSALAERSPEQASAAENLTEVLAALALRAG